MIIVFEGVDGSGKATTSEAVKNKLIEQGYSEGKIIKLDFPQYNSNSSDLVKSYLNNSLDGIANSKDIDNIYVTSLLFSLDRGLTFSRDDIKKYLDEDYTIILDRYTTSNYIHQGVKKFNSDIHKLRQFVTNLEVVEYQLLGLPKPDLVYYLHLSPEVQLESISSRGTDGDIHESDKGYILDCNTFGLTVADALDWNIINCSNEGKFRPREEILSDAMRILNK